MNESSLWAMIEAIATASGVIIAGVVGIIAVEQLREMVRSRRLEAMMRFYDLVRSEEARDDRRNAYSRSFERPMSLSSDEWQLAERVVVRLDRVGLLAKSGLIDLPQLLDGHYDIVIRSWKHLERYIIYRRALTGGEHGPYFEWLAAEAARFRDERGKPPVFVVSRPVMNQVAIDAGAGSDQGRPEAGQLPDS